jgi:hypothetical protein
MSERTSEPAGRPGGLAQAIAAEFSLKDSIGGPRGMIESVVPMTLFSALFGLGAPMRTAVLAAVATSVLFAVARLIGRQPVTQAVSGLFGIALGAFLALRTGRAENFVLPSLVKNLAFAAALALSALVRWPLLGVFLGVLLGENLHWRQVPARARAYTWATWLWSGMFVFRLAVQVPLWLAGAAAALGLVNVLLGLPLFAAVVWLTWLIIKRVPTAIPPGQADDQPVGGTAGETERQFEGETEDQSA